VKVQVAAKAGVEDAPTTTTEVMPRRSAATTPPAMLRLGILDATNALSTALRHGLGREWECWDIATLPLCHIADTGFTRKPKIWRWNI